MKVILVLILTIIVVFPQVCGTSQSIVSAKDVSGTSVFRFSQFHGRSCVGDPLPGGAGS